MIISLLHVLLSTFWVVFFNLNLLRLSMYKMMLLYFLCYKRSDRLLCKLFIFTKVLTWIERYILINDEIENGPELSYNYDNDINFEYQLSA